MDIGTIGMENSNLALQDVELFEALAKGLPYTWWNHHDDNPILKKIDHALINHHWSNSFPDAYADFLEQQQSDHSACLFWVHSLQLRVCKPFKFFHHVVDHPKYKDLLNAAWNCDLINGSSQFKLARTLKLLKHVLRRLNKRHYSGISERVKEQAGKFSDLQRILLKNPNPVTAHEDHQARAKWQTLTTVEEKFYRQKSLVQWLQLGNINTGFYHRVVAQRVTRNHIHFLKDHNDRFIGSSAEIKLHSAEYFQGIIGSTELPISSCSISQLQDLLPFR